MATTVIQLEEERVETGRKQSLATYDSGYEYSVEHWLELRRVVEDADEPEVRAN